QTNVIVTSLTACVQIYTCSAGVAYFCAGALACTLSAKGIKRLIKQPRPVGISKKLSYGMPSTHSASMAFYATYICATCSYLPLHRTFDMQVMSIPLRDLVPVIVVPWAVLVLASRVWLGHHTWQQVGVGCGFGVGFAGVWFALWIVGGLSVVGGEAENWFVANMIRS
ncbi:hypothetical protein BU17DRAFT_50707, partial [Hysterangium stoloniferum]